MKAKNKKILRNSLIAVLSITGIFMIPVSLQLAGVSLEHKYSKPSDPLSNIKDTRGYLEQYMQENNIGEEYFAEVFLSVFFPQFFTIFPQSNKLELTEEGEANNSIIDLRNNISDDIVYEDTYKVILMDENDTLSLKDPINTNGDSLEKELSQVVIIGGDIEFAQGAYSINNSILKSHMSIGNEVHITLEDNLEIYLPNRNELYINYDTNIFNPDEDFNTWFTSESSIIKSISNKRSLKVKNTYVKEYETYYTTKE